MRPSIKRWRAALLLLAFGVASPLDAKRGAGPDTLQQRVEARLAQAGPGPRFGLVVTDENGRELIAINPDERFIPASNTKIFTTAAAFDALGDVDVPDATGGASVRLEGGRAPDVVLKGHGDARLSADPDCVVNCLAMLADAVAAKTRSVRDVVGDDSLYPDQRWGVGVSWEDLATRYGTAASALTLDDNEVQLRVLPGRPGAPPRIEHLGYLRIDNRASTAPAGATALRVDRLPGSDLVRLHGTISAGAEPAVLRLGIDDPAHFAAWRLKSLLQARGVRVSGTVAARHRPYRPADDPAVRGGAPPPRPPEPDVLARLSPPPLRTDLTVINKASQNLHSELMLRRVGLRRGTGSIEDGLAAIEAMLDRAGVPDASVDLSDGSGMSVYNRVAPRGLTTLLRWIAAQPWGAAWRETLPIGGVDGTLARRFRGGPLEARVFAKTGTLSGTNALSGYLLTKSGRTLIFLAFANDMPRGVSGTRIIDSALELIASEN
jgi:D-alanyl-D-alanine carboxypeptidase/D-alanyl-D-alanine-endopeptidase (penicillin-binding protein 4)